jgi:hypothetical protein
MEGQVGLTTKGLPSGCLDLRAARKRERSDRSGIGWGKGLPIRRQHALGRAAGGRVWPSFVVSILSSE